MLAALRRQTALVTTAIVVVVVLASGFLFVLPRGADLARIRDEQAVVRSDFAALEAELAELRSLQASGTLDEEVAAAERRIPAVANLPEFLAALDEAALRSGVVLTTVAPGEPTATTAGVVSEIPVSVSAIGAYFPLVRFVFELEHLSRLLRIDGISVGSPVQGQGLELSVTAVAFTTAGATAEAA